MRERVARAKRDLRSLLDMLSQPAATGVATADERPAGATPAEPVEALPLLDGVPDSPPTVAPVEARRQGGREGAASNVE